MTFYSNFLIHLQSRKKHWIWQVYFLALIASKFCQSKTVCAWEEHNKNAAVRYLFESNWVNCKNRSVPILCKIEEVDVSSSCKQVEPAHVWLTAQRTTVTWHFFFSQQHQLTSTSCASLLVYKCILHFALKKKNCFSHKLCWSL